MDNVPQASVPVTYDALCGDIRRADPGSPLFYELIRLAKQLIREGKFDGTVRPE